MKEVAIIDYGAGNIASLVNAVEYLDRKPIILNHPTEKKYSHVLLPGVGSFGKLSKNLNQLNFDNFIKETLKRGGNLMGICIGMQLLFEESEESVGEKGLGLITGKLKKININNTLNLPLPHVGFNKVKNVNSKFFKVVSEDSYFYFIHSFCIKEVEKDTLHCTSEYGEKFVTFVEKNNLYGTQFHPEKSHKTGLKLLDSFFNI